MLDCRFAALRIRTRPFSRRALALSLVVAVCCSSYGADRPTVASSRLIVSRTDAVSTEFLLLKLREFQFDDDLRKSFATGTVGSGAFAVVGAGLVYATSNGKVFAVNLDEGIARHGSMPDVDLGAEDFRQAKHISYFETYPRVHDIVESGGAFYLSYDHFRKETDSIHFEVARLAPGERKWSLLYRSPALDVNHYTLGNGGALQIVGRQLTFSVGDYALDRINHLPSDRAAQNPALPWGKVLALNVDTRQVKTLSIGHRNIQGLLFLRNGRLLASEQGPRGGDKLAFIVAGGNHGWPLVSGGTEYASYRPIGDKTAAATFEAPFFEFVPSIAPTQLTELAGFDGRWDGDLLLASLKAQTLYRIRLSPDRVRHVEPIELGHRLRDVKQVGRKIVLLTDEYSFIVLEVDDDPNAQTRALGANRNLTLCSACHDLRAARANAYAPSLRGVFGRPIASSDFGRYSAALKAAANGRAWDQESLAAFIRNPGLFAKGTTMPDLHVAEADVQRIVAGLKDLRDRPEDATRP